MIILDFGHTHPNTYIHTDTKNENNKTRNLATDWILNGKDVERKSEY